MRIEIQVGPAVSSGSGPVDGEGDVLIVTGSLGVGCGVDSEIDRNFNVLPFCQSVWETTGGLEHLDPAIVH